LKAACERAATARFGEQSTSIVRPTYVCGPYDRSDRFTYWARRMAEGGDVVVLDANAPMQIVDARDLGSFLIHCAASRTAGAFDGVGPWAPTGELLAQITPPGVDARLIEVDSATLDAAGIELPMIEGDEPALSSRPGSAARAAGLTTRSVADTADATRRWDTERGSPELSAGPTRAQEADLVRSAGGRG
jgi:2'-hydroxyisoflavone reductase